MASFDSFGPVFEKDTPVLRFNYGKDPNARWVLWPVFAWRVVAPVPKERKLNLFQRAVLGLARAKVTANIDVADRLLIAPDLAALIMLELQNMALLDHAGEPTARGLKMLDEIEEDPPDEAQVGHVLTDPFTGKVWPRFLTGDLSIADVEINDSGWPVLLSGSAGDPWKDLTFSVLPSGREILMARPSAGEVLRAARRHRRQRDYDEVDDDRDVPRLQRVSFVDDHPQLYLLALRVCRHTSGDWMVDDPFGHGEAIELRARLEERLDSHVGLRAWIGQVRGGSPDNAHGKTAAQHQKDAEWEVEQRLTLAIRAEADIYDRLVAMHRALLEASEPGAPLDKWDDVLVKAQRAVERSLHTVYRNYRDLGSPLFTQLAYSDKEFNRLLLDKMATDLGFCVPLPVTLSSVRRGKVQYAERGGQGSLRPLVVLALLCADRYEEHPFRRAGGVAPDLLHRLDELATARDQAAHDGAATWPQRVQRHIDTAYAAVEAFLLKR